MTLGCETKVTHMTLCTQHCWHVCRSPGADTYGFPSLFPPHGECDVSFLPASIYLFLKKTRGLASHSCRLPAGGELQALCGSVLVSVTSTDAFMGSAPNC